MRPGRISQGGLFPGPTNAITLLLWLTSTANYVHSFLSTSKLVVILVYSNHHKTTKHQIKTEKCLRISSNQFKQPASQHEAARLK